MVWPPDDFRLVIAVDRVGQSVVQGIPDGSSGG